MLQITDNKKLRILYVASQCLFYFLTFRVEEYEDACKDNPKYKTKEDVLRDLYDILLKKEDRYYELVSYFKNETDLAQDELVLGIYSVSELTRCEFAENVLVEIELLDKPMTSTKTHSNMPEDF